MKLQMLAATALVTAFSLNSLAVADEGQREAFEADCKKYAVEDGVSPEEMDNYVAQCVQDLMGDSPESPAEAPDQE